MGVSCHSPLVGIISRSRISAGWWEAVFYWKESFDETANDGFFGRSLVGVPCIACIRLAGFPVRIRRLRGGRGAWDDV